MQTNPKKKILVLYYTQTGQLKKILDSILKPLESEVEVVFEHLLPLNDFSYPWSSKSFMGIFPETFLEVPVEMKPVSEKALQDYDLVVLGWQPWFLSPSLPVLSFLQSEEAMRILNGKPVVMVTGCRNMWINGFEKIRNRLKIIGASLAGNIVLSDPHHNLVSVVTVVGWMIFGIKEKLFGFMPASGVPEKEIEASGRFSDPIKSAVLNNDFGYLNEQLLRLNSVKIRPDLMEVELRGARIFRIWANLIRKKGNPGDSRRRMREVAFTIYLPVVILIASPVVAVFIRFRQLFGGKRLKEKIRYYLEHEKISNKSPS